MALGKKHQNTFLKNTSITLTAQKIFQLKVECRDFMQIVWSETGIQFTHSHKRPALIVPAVFLALSQHVGYDLFIASLSNSFVA